MLTSLAERLTIVGNQTVGSMKIAILLAFFFVASITTLVYGALASKAAAPPLALVVTLAIPSEPAPKY